MGIEQTFVTDLREIRKADIQAATAWLREHTGIRWDVNVATDLTVDPAIATLTLRSEPLVMNDHQFDSTEKALQSIGFSLTDFGIDATQTPYVGFTTSLDKAFQIMQRDVMHRLRVELGDYSPQHPRVMQLLGKIEGLHILSPSLVASQPLADINSNELQKFLSTPDGKLSEALIGARGGYESIGARVAEEMKQAIAWLNEQTAAIGGDASKKIIWSVDPNDSTRVVSSPIHFATPTRSTRSAHDVDYSEAIKTIEQLGFTKRVPQKYGEPIDGYSFDMPKQAQMASHGVLRLPIAQMLERAGISQQASAGVSGDGAPKTNVGGGPIVPQGTISGPAMGPSVA